MTPDHVTQWYSGPVQTLSVVLIAVNFIYVRVLIRDMMKKGDMPEVIAPLVLGHFATFVTTAVLGSALMLSRWYGRELFLHIEVQWLYAFLYAFAATVVVFEAISFLAWQLRAHEFNSWIRTALRFVMRIG